MITIILIFVLRSVKLALLCLVPNAVPLLVVAGISGWMGASLHLGILIVFSVGLGLAVDDTIHLMVRFKQLQKEKPGGDLRELMDEAIVSSGFAIVLTSVVLLISAACFLGSSFTTMRWTGVTLGIVAVTALLADLMVLPWLIEKFYRLKPVPTSPSAS
jgi:predicted RND superfamily exporter protein